MSPIQVIFTTPRHPGFSWSDEVKGLENQEIEDFITILRCALAAFSAELTDRGGPPTDLLLESYKEKIRLTANQINAEGLTEPQERQLADVTSHVSQADLPQAEGKKVKAGRRYLRLISDVVGWHYALLVMCALGKHKVERIDENQRIRILKYIAKDRESLYCRLHSLRRPSTRLADLHPPSSSCESLAARTPTARGALTIAPLDISTLWFVTILKLACFDTLASRNCRD